MHTYQSIIISRLCLIHEYHSNPGTSDCCRVQFFFKSLFLEADMLAHSSPSLSTLLHSPPCPTALPRVYPPSNPKIASRCPSVCLYVCCFRSVTVAFVRSAKGSPVQHITLSCNTLQHTATHCSICALRLILPRAALCNTRHYSTTHCNMLQHAATPCSTL